MIGGERAASGDRCHASLKNAAGDMVALNAPSRTFNLVSNSFNDGWYGPIVKVENCNKCHEALATTFHTSG